MRQKICQNLETQASRQNLLVLIKKQQQSLTGNIALAQVERSYIQLKLIYSLKFGFNSVQLVSAAAIRRTDLKRNNITKEYSTGKSSYALLSPTEAKKTILLFKKKHRNFLESQ